MKRIAHSVLVPYAAREMYDLVDRVERYPQFLPWCGGASVLDDRDPGRIARLDIDYHGIRAHFTTSNTNVPGESIVITLVDGPFRHLHSHWQFSPRPEGGCEVDFSVDFEFRNAILQAIIGVVFDEAMRRVVRAFEARAEALYGRP